MARAYSTIPYPPPKHFYIAQAGEANVLLGTRVEGSHLIAPGEWRSGKILDGKAYPMKPGTSCGFRRGPLIKSSFQSMALFSTSG